MRSAGGSRQIGSADMIAVLVVAVALAGVAGPGPAVGLAVGVAVEVAGALFVDPRDRLDKLVHLVAAAGVAGAAPLALSGYRVTDWLWTTALAYLCIAAAHLIDDQPVTSLGWVVVGAGAGFGVVTTTDARLTVGAVGALALLGLAGRGRVNPMVRPVAGIGVAVLVVSVERAGDPLPGMFAMAALTIPALLPALHWSSRWGAGDGRHLSIVDQLVRGGWTGATARQAILVPTVAGGLGAVLVGEDLVPWWAVAPVVALLASFAAVVVTDTRGGRPFLRWPLVVAGAVGVLAAAGSMAGLSVAGDLRDASTLARRGVEVAQGQGVSSADGTIGEARVQFLHARSTLDSPLTRLARAVPAVGVGLGSAHDLVEIGIDVTGHASRASELLTGEQFSPDHGVVPIRSVRALSEELDGLGADVERGRSITREQLRSPWLRPLRSEIASAMVRLDELQDTIEVGRQVAGLAPQLFGDDGPRRYLVVVATPSELRGSGGLIGSFGEIEADGGRLRLTRLERIQRLIDASDPTTQASVFDPRVLQAYDPFDLARFWQNRAAPPDFALAAEGMEAGYEAATGSTVDGTILVTPVALARILAVTGPIQVPTWPVPLSSENAAQVLLVDQYVALDGDLREEFLATVAGAVFERLISMTLPAVVDLVDQLEPAVAGGHLRVHLARQAEQDLSSVLGLDGGLPDPAGGDVVAVVTQNASFSKIDSFLRRRVDYDLEWDRVSGRVKGTVTVTLDNLAPGDGLPEYVIGGLGAVPVEPGTNRTYVSLYTPLRVRGASGAGGEAIPVSRADDGTLPFSTVLVSIPPGGSTEVRFAVEGRLEPGSYRLTVAAQPTAHPDRVRVRVVDRSGRPIRQSGPKVVDGGLDATLDRPISIVADR